MLHSRLPLLLWPALPDAFNAQVIALLHQFETSQYWPQADLQAQQFRQLAALLTHFARTSDFLRPRLAAFNRGAPGPAPLSPERWRDFPLLTRADIRAAGDTLFNAGLPPGHASLRASSSSGFSGPPVTIRKTEVNDLFHEALNLRNHVWHGRDFAAPFATLRRLPDGEAPPPDGATAANWSACLETGPSHLLNSAATTLSEQRAWLARLQPGYLFSYPSLLAGLARAYERDGEAPPKLLGLMGFGEVATPPQRAAIRRVFGHTLRDTYSAAEVSTIALQCPEHEDQYHVMSESLLVELIDAQGRPCPVGTPGRVVVTDLHNYVTPVLRYEIGDMAEWGPPCPCGRGLPTLRRIVGRKLNLLRLPGGDALVPDIERQDFHALAPIDDIQVVQHDFARIEIRLATTAPPDAAARARIIDAVRHGLHDRDFAFEITLFPELPRSPSGKHALFVCAFDPDRMHENICGPTPPDTP